MQSIIRYNVPAGKATSVYVWGQGEDESEKSCNFEESDFKVRGGCSSTEEAGSQRGVGEGGGGSVTSEMKAGAAHGFDGLKE